MQSRKPTYLRLYKKYKKKKTNQRIPTEVLKRLPIINQYKKGNDDDQNHPSYYFPL